ncbi:MAG: hypothetical protein H0U69_15865 [Trueperaceae bacterium]|nr:hypothetical protein [Trueperaceae bacterium]
MPGTRRDDQSAWPTRSTDGHLHLRTLGALALDGGRITRPKPLLLLAYLALEGPTHRGRLAGLFFGGTRDPRDALTTTVRRLGDLVATVHDGDDRLVTAVTIDAAHFQRQALLLDPTAALRIYVGPFVQDGPRRVGPELEEWITSTRERLACVARDLHLAAVRRDLRRRRTLPAWTHAREAVALTEAFALDPRTTADVLQLVARAGLPVPDGWWSVATPSNSHASVPPHRTGGHGAGAVRRSRTSMHTSRRPRPRTLRTPGARA